MINSRHEWTLEYLSGLREKFLVQGYPLKLINEQYSKALTISREELLFSDKKKKKKVMVAPLVVTFNPGNPPFQSWIRENLPILHEDDRLKKALPSISVVTRQAKNIEKYVVKSRHWKNQKSPPSNTHLPPAGNYKLHSKNCVTCRRMTDGKREYCSEKTGRTYKIQRHYTCESHTHIIYLVKCRLCNVNYVGQSTRTMRQRHLGHRAEIRSGADGLGKHFRDHGAGLDLKNETVFEEHIMQHFELTIIASVEPNKAYSQSNLDRLEGDFQKKLMTMDYHGGMNLRDETRRRHGS